MEHVILSRIYLSQQRWIIKINLKCSFDHIGYKLITDSWQRLIFSRNENVNEESSRFFLIFKVFSRRSRACELNEGGDPGIEWRNEGKRVLKDVKREIDEA